MLRADVGSVVFVRARLVAAYADHDYPGGGWASIRIAKGVTCGGRGRWEQVVVPFSAIVGIDPDPPDDEALVPRHIVAASPW